MKTDGKSFMLIVLRAPWAILCFVGRFLRRFCLAVGVFVVLVVMGYVGFEFIVGMVDSRFSEELDDHLGIDKNAISRLRDPAYFAEQSVLVSEDQKIVACISAPERRILINDPAAIPPLFTKAILASEDKNFFVHEGVDKGAIVRAAMMRVLQQSHSGASTLTMQIAKHLRDGTGSPSTELEKIGDIVMALRIQREFSKEEVLLKYINLPYFGRGQYGIEAASRAYFGKPAKDLALHQVALIVSPDRRQQGHRGRRAGRRTRSAARDRVDPRRR